MSLSASLVLTAGHSEPPTVTVQRTDWKWEPSRALGAVVVDNLTVQTSGDPELMRRVAAAFVEAADLMDALNAAIADEQACKDCGRRLDDDDPSNTGLGHHVDCTADGALAGQSA